MNKKTLNYVAHIFTSVLIFAVLVSVVISFLPHDNMWLGKERVVDFNDNWRHVDSKGNMQQVSLPTKLTAPSNTPVTLFKTLPNPLDESNSPRVFTIRTTHQNMKLYIDNNLIYEFGASQSVPKFSKTPGIAWNTVRISPEAAGKELKLVLTSPYETYSGYVGDVHMGTKAATIYWLLEKNLLWFIFALLFVSVGIGFFAVAIVFRKILDGDKSILYLAQFVFLIGIWLFCESRLTQFFGQNSLAFTNFAYYCLMLLLVPLINYITSLKGFVKKRLFLTLSSSICAFTFLSMILQILGVYDTFESLPFVVAYAAVCAITACAYLIKYAVTRKKQHIINSALAITIFLVCCIIEFISFLINPVQQLGEYIIIGALAFSVIIGHDSIQRAKLVIAHNRESQYYKRLALFDELTGCPNRTAYTSYKQGMKTPSGHAVIMCDVDKLKLINDKYGHNEGDVAIKQTAQILTDVFGNCYRVGGDEFVSILKINDKKQIDILVDSFKEECAKCEPKFDFDYNASIGYAIFDETQDKNIEQTINRADEAMYINKQKKR